MRHDDAHVTREMLTGFFVGLAISLIVIATGLLLDWSNGAIGGVIVLTTTPAVIFVMDRFEKPRRRQATTPRR